MLVKQGEITREGEIRGRTIHRLVEQGEVTLEGKILGRTVCKLVDQKEAFGKVKFLYGHSIY